MPYKVENSFEGIGNNSIRLIVSPSPLAKKIFFYAQEAGYLEMANSSYCVELSGLDSFLMLFVVAGKGKLEYDDTEYQLEADRIFLIDCKKYHKYYAAENDAWDVLYLYFNGAQARGYYSMIVKNKQPVFTVENPKAIASLFWQIISLHSKNGNFAEQLTSLHITRLLTETNMFRDNETVMDIEYPLYVNYIFNHINKYYNEKITLDLLAERYSVNKFHLAREFKRCSGSTINEYVITTRINKAKALLRYSNKSIEQIAEEVGFYSSSHFIKLFRNREHVTPLFYRKQWTK